MTDTTISWSSAAENAPGAPRYTPPQANPVRGRFNAMFFRAMDRYLDKLFGQRKITMFEGLPETVVEIGSGTGTNFRYFKPGTRVISIEPNPHMHAPLLDRAAKKGIDLTLVPRGAESTGLETESVEAVVSTLVLCTVPNVEASVREIHRILKPGGRLYFLEHVAAPKGSATRKLQERIAKPWSWLFEGCHTHRNTLAAIQRAGFRKVQADRYTARSPFLPVNPQVAGVATK